MTLKRHSLQTPRSGRAGYPAACEQRRGIECGRRVASTRPDRRAIVIAIVIAIVVAIAIAITIAITIVPIADVRRVSPDSRLRGSQKVMGGGWPRAVPFSAFRLWQPVVADGD